MINKENQNSQLQPRKRVGKEKNYPKSSQRYPLRQVDQDFNCVSISPQNQTIKANQKNHLSYSQNQKEFFSSKRSEFALSMKEKFKNMHLSSMQQFIGSVKQKINEIEDLMAKQQKKAQFQDLSQNQISASLRKLRKVFRLMEIVCKIIIGTNQHNSYVDISSQNQMSLRDLHELSINNFHKQLKAKNNQISRLTRLVNILSVPQKQKSLSNYTQNSIQIQQNKSLMLVKTSFQQKIENEIKKQSVIKQYANQQTQTQLLQLLSLTEQRQYRKAVNVSQKNFDSNIKLVQKSSSFSIYQEYSLWNILDAKTTEQNDKQDNTYSKIDITITKNNQFLGSSTRIFNFQKSGVVEIRNESIQTQTQAWIQEKDYQKMKYLNVQNQEQKIKTCNYLKKCLVQTIRVQPKSNFLKRYKSVLKIAINGLNLCNNIFYMTPNKPTTIDIKKQIQHLSQYFNTYYHNNPQAFDEEFCKQIREKLLQIYNRVYSIYKQIKIDQINFQSMP